MFATGFWSPLAAPILNGIALLLALGFRRNRAVLVAAVLACASIAIAGAIGDDVADRGYDAMRMFAPWLLLVAALTPERRLLARRNLVLLSALLITVWLTLAAPAHAWRGLFAAFPFGFLR